MENQREIKIRVWLKNEKRFSYHDLSLQEDVSGLAFILEKKMPNERDLFTGLKDKNGKEIYEGDLLISNEGAGPFETIFQDGCFVGQDRRVKGWVDLRIFEVKKERRTIWEVVGNIYENPELLK